MAVVSVGLELGRKGTVLCKEGHEDFVDHFLARIQADKTVPHTSFDVTV